MDERSFAHQPRRCREAPGNPYGAEFFQLGIRGILHFLRRTLAFRQLRNVLRDLDEICQPRDRVLFAGDSAAVEFVRVNVSDQRAKLFKVFLCVAVWSLGSMISSNCGIDITYRL